MKLWLLKQDVVSGYDTYDSLVVAALTEEDARKTHPSGDGFWPYSGGSWPKSWEQVTAELIGAAKPETKPGVICASFNAG